MIMPTPKPSWVWVIRSYNYETGKHVLIKAFDEKEEAHFYTRKMKVENKHLPINYEYEKIEKGRPDLHHEKLKEEWGYNK